MLRALLKDRYRIEAPLGEGGMGRVFRAFDEKLRRSVAIKLMPRLDRPTLVERFEAEARTIAALNHPNIVTVHDYDEIETTDPAVRSLLLPIVAAGTPSLASPGELDGDTQMSGELAAIHVAVALDGAPPRLEPPAAKLRQPFIVMEYLPGCDIDEAELRGIGRVLDAVLQVCDALEFAHARGIVHRDLKPENVRVLPGGRVKLLDFGIALFAERGRLTSSGELLGTFAYMSPEQAMGEKVDARTDVYSLALVLFELLTGELPFRDLGDEGNVVATLTQRVSSAARGLLELRPEAPPGLADVLQAALERDREQRTPSITELARALRAVRADLPDERITVPRQPPAATEPPPASAAARAPTEPSMVALLADLPGLVGREAELACLEALLDEAREGRGGAVFVGGEPGVGKSAVARAVQLMAEARGFALLHGRVLDESRVPFEPFAQMLRADLRQRPARAARAALGSDVHALAQVVHDLAALLETAAPPQPAGEAARPEPSTAALHDVLGAIHRYIERCAASRPVLVFLESFHDADADSVAALRRLLQGVRALPCLLLVEHCVHGLQREEPFHGVLYGAERDHVAQRLMLGRLSLAATTELVTRFVPAPTSALVAAVHHVTDGLPMHVAELLRALPTAATADATTVLELAVPHAVSEAIARTVDRLGAAHEAVLRCAAVLGRAGFEFDPLLALYTAEQGDAAPDTALEDAVIDALELATRSWLVRAVGEERYRFDSDLVWRTVYERIHPRRRSRMHSRAAEALEAQPLRSAATLLALTYHHALAARHDDDLELTAAHLERALECIDAPPSDPNTRLHAHCIVRRLASAGSHARLVERATRALLAESSSSTD